MQAEPALAARAETAANFAGAWDRFWFGEVRLLRPYWLKKGILVLLAFDVWLLRVDRAAIFGLDGFNIAHFDWLDAIQPIPGPGLYSGLMLFTGILAIVCAVLPASRWLLALLALTYTYGWAVSLLDGYQHHYLLSLFLFAFVFFPLGHEGRLFTAAPATPGNPGAAGPERSSRGMARKERSRRKRRSAAASGVKADVMVRSWAYALLGANIALVYAFTAFAKFDEPWRSGEVVQVLSGVRPLLAPVESAFSGVGLSREGFWTVVAGSVIAGELLIALGYLLAVRKDRGQNRWTARISWLAFITVIAFHAGLELFTRLQIGWFSYFMLWTAAIYFLPGAVLGKLTAPACWLRKKAPSLWSGFRSPPHGENKGRPLEWAAAFIVIVAAALICFTLDMPGSGTTGLVVALGLLAAVGIGFWSGRFQESLRYVFAAGAAVAVLWGALAHSEVRFRYYARVGNQFVLRQDPAPALAAYEKARRYAAPGHPRQRELERSIREIRSRLIASAAAQR